MKKLFTLLFVAASVFYQSCTPSSFATVGNNGWKVTLYHYDSQVHVSENGASCSIISDAYAAHKKAGYAAYTSARQSNGTYLYTNGIQLDKGSEKHTITLSKGDKTVEVAVERKSPPFIDVTAALGETKTMSYDDLQKEYLKMHKKG
jgi:hypothetical protein